MKRSNTSTGRLLVLIVFIIVQACGQTEFNSESGSVHFNDNWQFRLDERDYKDFQGDTAGWRLLDLPHDWSIEGDFDPSNPATVGGGALPGGVGWYRKTFQIPKRDSGKLHFLHFDGVYMNSTVYLNGHQLGTRPNGYISFRYLLFPHLRYGSRENELLVKVDNSMQPNSRWYSGSGIYRNVYLVKKRAVHIKHWSTFIQTPDVEQDRALVSMQTEVSNSGTRGRNLKMVINILGPDGRQILQSSSKLRSEAGIDTPFSTEMTIMDPRFWSVENAQLYTMELKLMRRRKVVDREVIPFGIRTFRFHSDKGFFLNGEPLKIKGVCNHHDLGALGAAMHKPALERQLRLLKSMGVNAIRTAHNPPSPQLLQLCDSMGFLVMNETFDMWKKKKSPYDYSMYWDDWHERDLRDHIRRDRNHASVFMWSIGNEILEQWDSTGTEITRELYSIVRELDTTRYIATGNNYPYPDNKLLEAGVMDVIGYNYKHSEFEQFPGLFPGKYFIATETTSGLMTRGHYDMPSDSIRRWPYRWDRPFNDGNPDHTVSSYDNVSTPWGSTHEEAWSVIKKHDYLSGMFIWTGFDYLGEPTPYGWPSRSSYFGIFDLAGFPKDVYYMYRSEWTDEPVLHVFPHWNWEEGKTVDIWAYTNCESVELFLNDSSLGTSINSDTTFHMMWRVGFMPGELKAVGTLPNGDELVQKVVTAGPAAKIELTAEREKARADGKDLVFVTARVVDEQGILVPLADNLIHFSVSGNARIMATDNGSQTSHTSFQSPRRNAFNGKALVIVQAGNSPGKITIQASAEGLEAGEAEVTLSGDTW